MAKPTPDARTGGLAAQWFGVLAGPLGWTTHLLLGYLLVSVGCQTHASGIDLALHVLTAVTALVAATGGLVAWHVWGEARRANLIGRALRTHRVEFMGASGMLFSGLFLFAILVADLATVVLPFRC